MDLPVRPPLVPMLARRMPQLPADGFLYEPKWDGFRCLAFRQGEDVDLRSRNDRPLARYFPELVAAARSLAAQHVVLDGEVMVSTERGYDFDALLRRVHPAARHVERMRQSAPASFVAFDLLAVGAEDLRTRGFSERRKSLEEVLSGAAQLSLSPVTGDRGVAERWLDSSSGGVDGVIAKHRDLPYQPGKRAMVKVKRQRTADCVVAGCRVYAEVPPAIASLLLGLYDDGELRHVGIVAAFTAAHRRQLVRVVAPYATTLEGHPWEHGFAMEGGSAGRLHGAAGRWTRDMEHDWTPLRPELVCEVAYDQVDGWRWRHPAKFVRWRPDRDPRSCTLDQFDPGSDPSGVLRL